MTKAMISILFALALCAACGDSGPMDMDGATELDGGADAHESDGASDDGAIDAGACSSESVTSSAVCSVYCETEQVCGPADVEPCESRCMAAMDARNGATRHVVRACVLATVNGGNVDCDAAVACLELLSVEPCEP